MKNETAVHSQRLLEAVQISQRKIEAGLTAATSEALAAIYDEAHNTTVLESDKRPTLARNLPYWSA
ncbi:hypothetical protein MNBD_CHLOROFLEXI01-4708 [hydrothermal vent metagenome]|uniref:Uncharacterized protein n=1 Tax=hydrothermal vent metagenome TaxID=652676 RepID=A0A3B0UVH3_9ZZZZ